MTTVEVPDYDIQDEISVSVNNTVLVVVDMQNDFAKPGGALYNPDAQATIPIIAHLIHQARSEGVQVIYTQDQHEQGDPEFEIWGEHVLAGTYGCKIVDELRPEAHDLVLPKSEYDGFRAINDATNPSVKRAIICGTVANICVHYTAASAAMHGWHVIHPVEAISALTDFGMEVALRQGSWLFQVDLVHAGGIRYER